MERRISARFWSAAALWRFSAGPALPVTLNKSRGLHEVTARYKLQGRDFMSQLLHERYLALISATVLLLLAQASEGATQLKSTGLICIDPIPKGSVWKANDTGAIEESVFSVQIDNQPPVNISTNLAGVFTNLPTASKHLVKIRLDGKPLTSFRFSFQESQSDHLRLWYNAFYGTWSLSPTTERHKCAYRG
jgi:hypothetical protein